MLRMNRQRFRADISRSKYIYFFSMKNAPLDKMHLSVDNKKRPLRERASGHI